MYDYLQPLDTMQRITREELAERLDELLEVVNRDEFAELLRCQVLYYYWAKTEWECIITDTNPQIGRNELCRLLSECYEQLPKGMPTPRHFCVNLADSYKLDVYSQVMLNWEEFVDYVWQYSKSAKKLKKAGT